MLELTALLICNKNVGGGLQLEVRASLGANRGQFPLFPLTYNVRRVGLQFTRVSNFGFTCQVTPWPALVHWDKTE